MWMSYLSIANRMTKLYNNYRHKNDYPKILEIYLPQDSATLILGINPNDFYVLLERHSLLHVHCSSTDRNQKLETA